MYFDLSPMFSLKIHDDFFSPLLRPVTGSFFSPAPYKGLYKVTHLYFPEDSSPPSSMEKTSIKVHGNSYIWLGNIGSPRRLNDNLNRLEKNTCCPTIVADIKAARSVVSQAANVFEAIKDLKKSLSCTKKELGKQTKTEEIKSQLAIVKKVWKKVSNIHLPKELTQESADAYAKKTLETLQGCLKMIQPEETVGLELNQQNEKTKAIGNSIIQTMMVVGPKKTETAQEVPVAEKPVGPSTEATTK